MKGIEIALIIFGILGCLIALVCIIYKNVNWLIIKQVLCFHSECRYSSGYDWSETVCLKCGLRHGVEGKDYGKDWNKIDGYKTPP